MARKPIEERLRPKRGMMSVHGFAHGKPWNQSTGFTVEQYARDPAPVIAKATEMERDRLLDEKGETIQKAREREKQAQELTLEQACEKLFEYDDSWGRSDNTKRFHRERCASLQRGLGAKTRLVQLTADPNTLIDYFEKRLAAASTKQKHTIQKDYRVLKQVLERCAAKGLWKGNPAEFQLEQLRSSKDYYTPGETWLDEMEYIDALVDEISSGRSLVVRRGKRNSAGREWVNRAPVHTDRKLNIILYCNLGLRDSELQTIYPHHVMLRNKLVAVNYPPDSAPTDAELKMGKTPEAKRVLGLNAVALETFKRQLKNANPDEPLFKEWQNSNRDLKAAWRRARQNIIQRRVTETQTLKGEPLQDKLREIRTLERTLPQSLCFNDLRRTFCSQMAKAGVPLQTCADIMGHADDAMVKRVYRRCAPAQLQAAMDMMPAIALPPVQFPKPKKALEPAAPVPQVAEVIAGTQEADR